jgi:hypothetical protein
MLRLVVPFEVEEMRVAIDGVGYGDHLVKIGRDACKFGQILLSHRADGFAVMKVGPVGIVVE